MGKYLLLFFIVNNTLAQEVIKHQRKSQFVDLKIIRVDVDSFNSYRLTNENLIDMSLVCAHNPSFDRNPTAIIRYRNFYNLPVYDFKITDNSVCKELGKFIESAHMAVDEEDPFRIRLDINTGSVTRIIYPRIDPFTQEGEIGDLLPKKRFLIPIDNNENNELKVLKN